MTSEPTWIEVNDQRAADGLIEVTYAFHDAVVTSATWEGAEFVNMIGELEFRGFGSLILRVKSQLQDVAPLELRFEEVRSFRYDYDLELGPVILVQPEGVTARLMAWEFQAHRLGYRVVAAGPNDGCNR